MLLAASFSNKKQAKQFGNCLHNKEINYQIRQHADLFEVWIEQQEQLTAAKKLHQAFVLQPEAAEFNRPPLVKKDNTRKLHAHYRKMYQRPHGFVITILLISISIMTYLLMLSPFRNFILYYFLIAVNPLNYVQPWLLQPWRLITPIFLHFSIWHILFNMYWLYFLGKLIETNESRLLYLTLILVCAIGSNLLQLFMVNPMFGGMSGVVYGLFGYLWVAARFNLKSGYYMRSDIIYWMVGWLILGFTGFIGPVANFGHLGGLLSGCAVACYIKLRQSA